MSSGGTNWPNEAEIKYLLDAWPTLAPHIREAIFTLVDAGLLASNEPHRAMKVEFSRLELSIEPRPDPDDFFPDGH